MTTAYHVPINVNVFVIFPLQIQSRCHQDGQKQHQKYLELVEKRRLDAANVDSGCIFSVNYQLGDSEDEDEPGDGRAGHSVDEAVANAMIDPDVTQSDVRRAKSRHFCVHDSRRA